MAVEILLSSSPLDVSAALLPAYSDGCGGVNVFIGNVRDSTKGKKVLRLEFEAYEPMAEKELQTIATTAGERWGIKSIVIHHRTGTVLPGETAVIIAVAAAHRGEAFEACRYAIDTLKQNVTIWKKEVFEDGEVWVAAHP
jgi:molybdopterin synthase catalytic subunit